MIQDNNKINVCTQDTPSEGKNRQPPWLAPREDTYRQDSHEETTHPKSCVDRTKKKYHPLRTKKNSLLRLLVVYITHNVAKSIQLTSNSAELWWRNAPQEGEFSKESYLSSSIPSFTSRRPTPRSLFATYVTSNAICKPHHNHSYIYTLS